MIVVIPLFALIPGTNTSTFAGWLVPSTFWPSFDECTFVCFASLRARVSLSLSLRVVAKAHPGPSIRPAAEPEEKGAFYRHPIRTTTQGD